MDLSRTLDILLIEDNPMDAMFIKNMIEKAAGGRAAVAHADTIEGGLSRYREKTFDVVLADLLLPDSGAYETVDRLTRIFSQAPVVILSGLRDEDLALEAVDRGAQDYLLKGEFNAVSLWRTIRFAVARHPSRERMFHRAMFDQVTGLYNESGFMRLAHSHMKVARLYRFGLALFRVDIDSFDWIRQNWGYKAADQAASDVADMLHITFREADAIARTGESEFMVLSINVPRSRVAEFEGRLRSNLATFNYISKRPCGLSLNIESAHQTPMQMRSMEQLVHQVRHCTETACVESQCAAG